MTMNERIKLLNENSKRSLISSIILLFPLCVGLLFTPSFQIPVVTDVMLIVLFFIIKEVTAKIITKC